MAAKRVFQMLNGAPIEMPVSKEVVTVENAIEFSADEKVVGTWTDGRPIYRKSWFDISYNSSGTLGIYIGVQDLNIDQVLSIKTARRVAGTTNNGYSQSSNAFVYYSGQDLKGTKISGVSTVSAGTYIHITIEYTKKA